MEAVSPAVPIEQIATFAASTPPLVSVSFTREEILMLWQMLNLDQMAAPLKVAHVAQSLYAKARAAAEAHGLAA